LISFVLNFHRSQSAFPKWGTPFDVAGLKERVAAYEARTGAADFWNDMDSAQKTLREMKSLKAKIGRFEEVSRAYDDARTLIQMGIEENDAALIPECREAANAFTEAYERFRIDTLLSGEYDRNNAILTLHAGAGGTESCDWVSMLYRMYCRYAEKKGYSCETLDYLPGDEAGIKSVTMQVNGENAYGYLKAEKGVHRLVRVSPFDAAGKRHTSFASLEVMPELDDGVDVEIKDEDLKVDTYRSSGAGGQHVNTTDSAIRITHIPTGTIVNCQNERSQVQNRARALKMLKAKLFELKRQEQMDKVTDIRGEVKDIGWSSQIRSYVFHPYSMVKDHRTNAEIGNVQGVMDGNIDPFINAYLVWLMDGAP
jgi:peptide chain release factor 2